MSERVFQINKTPYETALEELIRRSKPVLYVIQNYFSADTIQTTP